MTLGELIQTLESLDASLPIQYDFGSYPGDFQSWRGAYRDLTLCPDGGDWTTVGMILVDAKAADGHTFEGYKGGDFTMNLGTAVWADDYGVYTRRIITGISAEPGHKVIINTFVLPWEYS